jgi:hypothetical protein
VKKEASPPKRISPRKKIPAVSNYKMHTAEKASQHHTMEVSPPDRLFLRSAEDMSSKSLILGLTFHVEASNGSLAKQIKTKVIKKEPVPRQWSPSQLRLKRYPPPDASMNVARELFPINTMVVPVPRELSPITRLQKAVMDA